jgi:hypothetical protein
MTAANLIGQVFGRLTVIERYGSNKHGKAVWLCGCLCGNTTKQLTGSLRNRHSVSCGCRRKTAHASQDRSLKDAAASIAIEKLKETKECETCGGEMPVWKLYYNKNGAPVWRAAGRNCSDFCVNNAKQIDPTFRARQQERLLTKNKSAEGRSASRRGALQYWSAIYSGQRPWPPKRLNFPKPEELRKAATFASSMVVALGNAIGLDRVAAPEITIKLGGPKRVPIVRLPDGAVFVSVRHAARILSVGREQISAAIPRGYFVRQYQFMRLSDWETADKPAVHPQTPRRIVRLSDKHVFGSTEVVAAEIGGTPNGVRKSTQTGYPHHGHCFMQYEEWLVSGKPDMHPRRYDPMRARGGITNPDKRFLRQRAVRNGRVVRLGDGKIFGNTEQAAMAVGGTRRGILESCRLGGTHRGHRFMRYEEWVTHRP